MARRLFWEAPSLEGVELKAEYLRVKGGCLSEPPDAALFSVGLQVIAGERIWVLVLLMNSVSFLPN